MYINITAKELHNGVIYKISAEDNDKHSVKNVLSEEGFWRSQKNYSFIIDYKKEVPVNYIEIHASPSDSASFPSGFQISVSF